MTDGTAAGGGTATGEGRPGLVLLAYLSRSGSTFLATLLDAHPRVVVTPEAWFPPSALGPEAGRVALAGPPALECYLAYLFDDYKLCSWGVPRSDLRRAMIDSGPPPWPASELLRLACELYAARRAPGGPAPAWIVFKEGRRALFHPEAARRAWPGCRLLHVVRDPRAVYASQRRSRRSRYPLPFTLSPGVMARDWAGDGRLAVALEKDPDYLRVRYEDLVTDHRGTLGRVLGWLGCDLPVEGPEAAAGYGEVIPPEQRHLHESLRTTPDPARLEAWRSRVSAGEEALVLAAAAEEMGRLGYPVEGGETPPGAWARRVDRLKERLLRLGLRGLALGGLVGSPARLGRRIEARRRGW